MDQELLVSVVFNLAASANLSWTPDKDYLLRRVVSFGANAILNTSGVPYATQAASTAAPVTDGSVIVWAGGSTTTTAQPVSVECNRSLLANEKVYCTNAAAVTVVQLFLLPVG